MYLLIPLDYKKGSTKSKGKGSQMFLRSQSTKPYDAKLTGDSRHLGLGKSYSKLFVLPHQNMSP